MSWWQWGLTWAVVQLPLGIGLGKMIKWSDNHDQATRQW